MGQQQRDLFELEPPPWVLDDQSEQGVAVVVFAETPFGPYDYEVPDALRAQLQLGARVQVPLGRGNQLRIGYCIAVEQRPRGGRPLKPLRHVIDARSLLSPAMLRLTHWMADHYLCPLGQVLDAVLPASVRDQAGTRAQVFLRALPDVHTQLDALRLPAKQAQALQMLARAPQGLTPDELARGVGCTLAPIQALRRKRLVRDPADGSGGAASRRGRALVPERGSGASLGGDSRTAAASLPRDHRDPRSDGERQDGGLHPGHRRSRGLRSAGDRVGARNQSDATDPAAIRIAV